MFYILSFVFSISIASASDCNYVVEDFNRLSQTINDNNSTQSNNLDYVGNYMLNLHGSLKEWEGRKVAVPRGQFNFLKADADLIKEVADTSTTIAKDVASSLAALQKRMSECIK